MGFHGQPPNRNQDPNQYIEQKIIEPLLAFRKNISPLNQNYIEGVAQFAQTIAGLLTGSDGGIAMQGPGANALADLISTYLDQEEHLAGSFPDLLQGRLLDASVICEKYAHQLQESTRKASAFSPRLLAADEGGNDFNVADEVADETTPTYWGWQGEMESGPNTEPLRVLPELGPRIQAVSTLGGNYAGFLKLLGITVGVAALGAGVYLGFKDWPVEKKRSLSSLSPDELESLKDYLAQETGCSPTQIQRIVDQIMQLNPTAAQLKALLDALKLKAQLQMLFDEVNATGNPQYTRFANGIKDLIERISQGIDHGDWTDNVFLTQVRGWQNNLNGFALQWQAAQTLGATSLEQPMTGGTTENADLIDLNHIWYESKADSIITRGSEVYLKILKQLAAYIDDPMYTALNGRGVGVIVSAAQLGKGIDRNLGAELLQDLKKNFPNDPGIQRLTHIDVKPIPYSLPDPSSNRWCRM